MFHIFILFFLSLNLSATILLPKEKDNFYKDIQYYEDNSNKLTIKDITKKDFNQYENKYLNFGHTKSTIWLKLEFTSKDDQYYILNYGRYLVDYLDLFYIKDDEIIKHFETGNKRKSIERVLESATFAFPFSIKKSEKLTLFVKIKSSKIINIPMKIENEKEFTKSTFYYYLFIICFFTTLFISLFYTSVLYFITFKNIFSIYIGYLISNIVAWFVFSGLSGWFVFINYPKVNEIFLYTSLMFLLIFFVKFSIEILKVENKLKETLSVIKFFTYIILPALTTLNILFIYFDQFSFEIYTAHIFLYVFLFILLAILLIGISKIIKRDKVPILFSSFWILKTLFLFICILNIEHTFFDVNLTLDILKVSIILESLCIPMILGYRLRLYEKKNDRLKQLYRDQKRLSLENYRLSSNANLVNIIAHQLKQPLNNFNSIALNIETSFLANKLDKKYLSSKLNEIEIQTEYMSDTINTFTNYFHPNKKREYFNIYDTVIECLNLLSTRLSNKKIKYSIRCADKNIETEGYRKEYIQVLLILINNAIEAFEPNQDKNIKFYIFLNRDKKPVFTIRNNGIPIPKELSEKIFEPTYTTKGKQHGLGLFLAKRIIESMNKKIEHKVVPNGAKFNIIG